MSAVTSKLMVLNDLACGVSSSSSSSGSHTINSFNGRNTDGINSSMIKHGSLNNSINKEVKVG